MAEREPRYFLSLHSPPNSSAWVGPKLMAGLAAMEQLNARFYVLHLFFAIPSLYHYVVAKGREGAVEATSQTNKIKSASGHGQYFTEDM